MLYDTRNAKPAPLNPVATPRGRHPDTTKRQLRGKTRVLTGAVSLRNRRFASSACVAGGRSGSRGQSSPLRSSDQSAKEAEHWDCSTGSSNASSVPSTVPSPRAFKSEVQPVEIASAIRRAMDDRAAVLGQGRTIVPNLFTVELSDTDYDRLGGYDEELENELIAAAQEHAESQRYQPGGPLQVQLRQRQRPRDRRLPAAHLDRPPRAPSVHRCRSRCRPAPSRRRDAAAAGSRASPAGRAGPAADPPSRRAPRATATTTDSRRPSARHPSPRRPRRAGSTPPTGRGSTSTASATRSWGP